MPDERGTLSPEEGEKAIKWLRQHVTQPLLCPMSGHDDWVLGDRLVRVPAIRADVNFKATYFPMALLTCQQCGYTAFFSAMVIGIQEPPGVVMVPGKVDAADG